MVRDCLGEINFSFTLRADQDLSLISQDDLFGVFKNQSNFGGGLKESDADRTRRRDSEDASRRALEIVDSLFSSHDFHRMPNSLWLRAKKVQLWAHEKIFGEDESVIANRKEVLDRLANEQSTRVGFDAERCCHKLGVALRVETGTTEIANCLIRR